jgi:hypothetical protein
MSALIPLVALAILALVCWVVAKGPLWLRLLTVASALCLSTYSGLLLGRGVQKGVFLSGHIHWFTEYSAVLRRLADAGDCDALRDTIVRFDTRFRVDPQDEQALEDVMCQILEVGPYSKPKSR